MQVAGSVRPLPCLAVLLVAILAGCVQRYDLDKPGITGEQERIDWGLCGGDFLPGGRIQIAGEDSGAVLACMREKGYRIRPIGLLGR